MTNRTTLPDADLTGRTHSLQTSLRVLIALALAMISLPFLSTSASAGHGGGIVIDGNRDGNDDWAGHTAAPGYAMIDDQISDSTKDDDVFKGSHEAHLPSTWSWGMGSPSTGDDIGKTESFTTVDTAGHVWLYLGFARKADGVTGVAFELNQLANGTNEMPNRSQGDVRITFSQGTGNTALDAVGADVWDGAKWVNAGLQSTNYNGQAGEQGLFAELEINLTAAGLRPPCGAGFTQVNLRSRASDSDSALKDYVKPLPVSISAPCQSIRVEKYDADTSGALSGAKFKLYKDDGDNTFEPTTGAGSDTLIGTEVSANQDIGSNNTNNAYSWNDLAWGTYWVQESGRPLGYSSDPDWPTNVQRVVLGSTTGTEVVRFRNPQTKAAIQVKKFNKSDGDKPLTGAKFKLYKDDGNGTFEGAAGDVPVGLEVTANQGTAPNNNTYTWSDLAYGKYFVQESRAPAGFDTDPGSNDGVRAITLGPADAGQTMDVEFYNPALVPKIQVSKFDATSGDPLSGASFKLYEDDGDTVFEGAPEDTLVSGPFVANGGLNGNSYTWATGLSFGTTYFVQESVVPTGYDVDPAGPVKSVTVSTTDTNSLAKVDFNNPQKTAQIRVEKFSFENPRVPLSDATFRLYRDGGNGVWDAADLEIGVLGTADQGANANTFTWSDQLGWGDYLVKEIDPPNGYTKDPVAVAMNDAKLVQIRRADGGSVVSVEFNDPQLPVIPDPVTRDITVTKTDADTGFEVGGATFELYFDDGDGVAESGELRDSNPPVTGPGAGTYTWNNLPDGAYLVKEATPPSGYLPPVVTTQTVPDSGNVTFSNRQIRSTIVLTKTDKDTGSQVDTGRFELWKNGVRVIDPSHDSGTGVYTWSGLLMGDYVVKEATPPDGYLPPVDDTKTVPTINKANAGGTFSVGFQNQKEATTGGGGDPVRTAIEVTKRDATTSQPVDTATFQLWEDQNGNGTLEPLVDVKVSTAKNTANGVANWVGLLKGIYFVEETVAPKGYDLPANSVLKVDVDGIGGGTLKRSFYDPQKQTTIELVKRADDTRQELAGAVFQAYLDVNKDGLLNAGDTKIGGTKISDANGVVSWSGLKFGHYVIHEVTPPDNYDLAADQSVVLDQGNAGGTVSLDFLDPAIGAVTITKVAYEKNAAGQWVPSDGEVEFGDLVKYELTADAYGAKMYRDVWVVDYIPGFDPADTKSTTKASYVQGSATCDKPATCPVTFEADEQELAWSLGDMQGVERTVEFVVRMPLVPVAPVYDEDGRLIETVVNVAELSWLANATESTQRVAAEYGNRSIRSNEVVTTIVDQPQVLDTPPAERPETVKRPGALLPDTGAPTHSALFGTLGSLSLLLGAWLVLVSRGRGYLPQR